MAWTNPKTWSVGETLTAANFNTHIRDNELALGPHLIVRKTADESVTSSTTFQADDVLLVNIPANEIWLLEWKLLIVAGTTGDFKAQWTFPASGEFSSSVVSNVSGTITLTRLATSTSPAGQITHEGAAGSIGLMLEIPVLYKNAGTGGNVALEWAQNNSDATATTVKANSTLWGMKLA